MERARARQAAGCSLGELLVGVVIVGLLASLGWRGGSETLARQRLEVAMRRLDQGIQRGRAEAQKRGQPCGLRLEAEGWRPPELSELAPCLRTLEALQEPIAPADVQLTHNFPGVLRFSRNGLVLDGGTAVVQVPGLAVQRCLVMALPLGITRMGQYQGGQCRPEPSR